MKRRPHGLIITCFVLAGLVVIVLILHASLTFSGKRGLERRFAEIRARGEQLTFQELAPRPVPPYENAALIYEQAFKALKLPERDGNLQKFLDEATSPGDRAKLEPEVREIIKQNEPVFALIEEAASKPKCVFPVRWEDGRDADLSHLSKLRRLCRLVSARASLEGSEGATEGVLRDISLMLRMSDALSDEPSSSSYCERVNIIRQTSRRFRSTTDALPISVSQAHEMYSLFGGKELKSGFVRALHYERLENNYLYDDARKDLWAFYHECVVHSDYAYGHGPAKPGLLKSAAYSVAEKLWLPVSYRDEEAYLDWWAKNTVLLADTPYREVDKMRPPIDELDAPKYVVIARMGILLPSRFSGTRDIALAEIGLAQTAMALKAYQSLTGSYPASLDELRTRIDWPIPDDPFSGKPFVYKRSGQGFLLYSWGWNLKDDGGKTTQEAISAGDINRSDLVWKCER